MTRYFFKASAATQFSLRYFLSLSLLFVAFQAYGDTYNFGASSNNDDFLSVDQAYQANVELHNNSLETDWTIAPGYYLYQHRFKMEAYNTEQREELELQFAPGLRKYDDYYQKELEVYYDNTTFKSAPPSIKPPYELLLVSQGCADAGLCYPPRKQYFQVDTDGIVVETPESTIESSASTAVTQKPSAQEQTPASPSQPFNPLILLGALLGGLILNLMPCVFPVLSLKALSFASNNHQDGKQHLHGWAYTLGVVISFLIAASIILVARHTGEALGWGFQLQQPLFVVILVYLFLVMGLSLFGAFHFGTSLMGAGQGLTTGDGLGASFFTGVLAAVVASPCTAPFMATALGVALTQPAPLALLVFACLGFGMALPFLALSYSPALARYLPSPGPWMDVLKQVLAFPLLATCVWLLWVLGNQSGVTGTAMALLGALFLYFALWLTQFEPRSTILRWINRGLVLVSLLAVAHFSWHLTDYKATSSGTYDKWQTFSMERLNELREQGEPVFVNLTADWCITCKVNERVAFSSQDFFNHALDKDVNLLIGDWTNANPEIEALLAEFNRSGIPLYLMFPAGGGDAEILPQLLTPKAVINAIDRAVE
ncbi:C-type cytochrome biogenesis protein [Teredinibacter turnerae T7901]|uniref:C-type cytochrome biogenesis protein n=1 Tax=Teredinibacter turnerae (strain ATCC 39867 / T7901) TaxID=377629 RepID=C5BP60_TERTT|nr:protein-disulfide reductase DsbD [Teredinibacter turnerae]ACR14632.1 C-type cytochrome biogenesis protein [Teredinibacter turnerae T7901]